MTDSQKPTRSPADERRRRITSLSFDQVADLETQAVIAFDFIANLKLACQRAAAAGMALEPESLIKAIDAMSAVE